MLFNLNIAVSYSKIIERVEGKLFDLLDLPYEGQEVNDSFALRDLHEYLS